MPKRNSIGFHFCFFFIWRNIFLCPTRVLLFHLFYVVWQIYVIIMFTIFESFIWHLEIIGHDVVLPYSKLREIKIYFIFSSQAPSRTFFTETKSYKYLYDILRRDNAILQITKVCVVYLCKYYGIDLSFLLCFVSLGSSHSVKIPLYYGTKQNLILYKLRNKRMGLLINVIYNPSSNTGSFSIFVFDPEEIELMSIAWSTNGYNFLESE